MATQKLSDRLEDMQLQKELKEQILHYVRAIYAPQNPDGHGYVILFTRFVVKDSARNMREMISPRVIVYTEPDSYAKWKLLKEVKETYYSFTPALQELLKEFERDMWKASRTMMEGEVYEGAPGMVSLI